MQRIASLILASAFLAHAVGAEPPVGAPLPAPLQRPVDFATEILPLLQERCVSCHGSEKQKGGLRLDTRAGAMKGGGELGPMILPGRSAESPLIRVVAGLEPDLLMPKGGEKLSGAAIALLRAWVDQGATWPGETEAAAQPTHWAFVKPVRPEIPRSSLKAWGRNPVDAFILARLEKEHLAPSPEADRRALIRRLSFDLVGLPPTPEEVQTFERDRRPDAYERVVDRLLASPRHGERWARHWLDVVRFSETHGFEMNQPRPNAWPYRDYVIRALNEDKPYDRFVTEQLAGDTLGADDATGFLVAGAWDQVKSPDVVLTSNQRADELHDMVGVAGTAFLGVTLGCARCHEHKFDPVPQRDYYAVKAVFEGVQHGERSWRRPGEADRERDAAEARLRFAVLEKELEAFEALAKPGRPESDPAKPGAEGWRVPVNAQRNSERFAAVSAKRLRLTIQATTGAEPCVDELEVFAAGEPGRNVALASAGTHATASGTFPNNALHRLEHINDGRYGNSRSWISNESGRGWVELEFPADVVVDRVVWARDREGQFRDRLATDYRIEVWVDAGEWREVASSKDRLPFRPDGAADASAGYAATDAPGRARLAELLKEREGVAERMRRVTDTPRVYAGEFRSPEPTRRLHRGDPMQPREPVDPGALSGIGGEIPFRRDGTAESSRRAALAGWITHPGNPLTARVIVNRLWQYHFGEGLVSTPNDFGANGARPTHPELLDWLACELVEGGWSLKRIHRLIVTSAAYRQSSEGAVPGMKADGSTRLLWRFPPRRLDAEVIRDSILAVSGNLDLRMGGPGFSLFEPNDNYVRVYAPRQRFGPAEWRRMIYATQVRQRVDGVFGAFDCPDGGQSAPRRTRSTTPLQALNLMNSGFTTQQAGIFAARVEAAAGKDPRAQVRQAFSWMFNRSPDRAELKEALDFVRDQGLGALARVLFNSNEFVHLR
jgi:cytochrome c553